MNRLTRPKNENGKEEIFDPRYHLDEKRKRENNRYGDLDPDGNYIPRPQPQPATANKTAKRKTLVVEK